MVLEFGGLQPALALEYLKRLGGQVTPDGAVRGPGWIAQVTGDSYTVPGSSLWVDRVQIALAGPRETLAALAARLRLMALRGGG